MSDQPHTIATYPFWLRLTHWLNAIAIIIMIMSGWQIYNASPLFNFKFSTHITLGGWLAGAIMWHFAAMWLLAVNGIFYLVMAFATGRIQRKFFPLNFKILFKELFLALRLKLHHDDLSHYNMLQKLAYIGVILAIILTICSGLVLWKSVQFPLLNVILGGYDNARLIHFIGMSIIVAFIIVHVALVAIVPRTLVGMIRGRA